MVAAIDRDELVKYTNVMDSFVTRNTMSETESDIFGIGAARRWIFTTMSESIPQSPNLPDGTVCHCVTSKYLDFV